ncbi:MAG: AMP-binding protein [Myxococcota bacterium]
MAGAQPSNVTERRISLVGAESRLTTELRNLCDVRGIRLEGADLGEGDAVLFAPSLPRVSLGLEEIMALFAELDEAIARAQALGAPVVMVSSLEVLGEREGNLLETEPTRTPHPRAAQLGGRAWSLPVERDVLRLRLGELKARGEHADLASIAEERARARLRAKKEPTMGLALFEAVAAERSSLQTALYVDAAQERAEGWGFRSIRGYALALCEGLLATSGLRYAIVRCGTLGAPHRSPSIDDDKKGARPLRALAEAVRARPGSSFDDRPGTVELLPVDLAAEAVLLTLFAALKGRAPPVIHASLTEQHPLSLARVVDLVDLHARRFRRSQTSSWVRELRRVAQGASDQLEKQAIPLEPELLILGPAQTLRARQVELMKRQLGPDASTLFVTSTFDWRTYLLERQLPTVLADSPQHALLEQEGQPLRAYDNLVALLEEGATRYQRQPALTWLHGAERSDLSYRELLARARAVARRLEAAGVMPEERVLLSGANHPDWVICCFGVLLRGAVLVPLDPALSLEQAQNIQRKAQARVGLFDEKSRRAFADDLDLTAFDLHLFSVSGPAGGLRSDEVESSAVASILFTSGTTGEPKGVMLTHGNFTSLVASLATVFDVHGDDRLLSVLPLHHTFEFSCGLLLPLLAGGQVHYLDELTGERLLYALKEARVTAMVGVPALWQLLERRLRKQVEERGALVRTLFDLSLKANHSLAQRYGMDGGRLLFRVIHQQLGGHLRTLISGGAALPADVHRLFHGLGLPIAEGYGLTEAAPVLTVAEPIAGAKAGTVGRAIPGVEIRILDPDERGVGEVLARGPNVMKGYFGDDNATRAVLDEDGWLHTGDLGTLGADRRLTLVGRAKDVVVTAAGENIYLDDVEARLGEIPGVEELTLFGVNDARGGEKLALAYVVAKAARPDDVRRSVEERLWKLPKVFRPGLVREWPDPTLPRTATRKVKRKEVRHRVEDLLEQQPAAASTSTVPPLAAVRGAIALVAGIDATKLRPDTGLAADLGFDSLMWVELQSALAPLTGTVDAEALFRCGTVGDLEAFVRRAAQSTRTSEPQGKRGRDTDHKERKLPKSIVTPGRALLGRLQRELYETAFDTEVSGSAHIPHNRSCIVVANHTSHLDVGLVKHALGRYGEGLTPLAARDYFFAGHPWKVGFFENFTNLRPIDRETGSGRSFEQAVEAVQEGHVILIFPEGTRREDGVLADFKPLVGRLSLRTGVDVLPLYLEGAYEALPKGATLPRRAPLRAHIGPPLEAQHLLRLTAHLPAVAAARAATGLIRAAVEALRDGATLELSDVTHLDVDGRPTRFGAPKTEVTSRYRA